MKTTFNLTIELGNEAMQTPADIARELRKLAHDLELYEPSSTIRDYNGNTVGRWEYVQSND